MYRVTYCGTPDVTARLKNKNGYPYPCGGIAFDEKTVHECDDPAPFLYYGAPVPWIKVEEIHEESNHGESKTAEVRAAAVRSKTGSEPPA